MARIRIEEQGRCGTVTYDEGDGSRLACYWEFGGDGDVVAYVQCGNESDWLSHPWTLGRRPEILQAIADEVVRLKAPSCRAEVDASAGTILLRQAGASGGRAAAPRVTDGGPGPRAAAIAPVTRAAEARWVFRLTALRMKLGVVVLVAAVLLGAGLWLKDRLLSIDPGKGTAIGDTVRTDRHVATLIQTLQPYVPTLDRNHGNDRYDVSLFLVPLDGSPTHLILLRRGLAPGAAGTARIFGSDGRTLWFDAAGLGGVRLEDHALLPEAAVAAVNPRSLPRPWGDWPLPPQPEQMLDRDAATGAGTEWLDAALLRRGKSAPAIEFTDPPGALMLFTSAPGAQGTAVVARVDGGGQPVWRADTGISRFGLRQILPGEHSTVFVGTRPPVPDQVSEPRLVIVDHASGRQVTHSLWQ